jgi:hypothetical protein
MYLIPKYSLKDTKVFECIQMYLNVFIVYVNVFEYIYSIFVVYFNVFESIY